MSEQYHRDGRQRAARKGVLGTLFDFSFTHFLPSGVVPLVYTVGFLALGVSWLTATATAWSWVPFFGLLILLFGPLGVLIGMLVLRMFLEIYLAVTRPSRDARLP